MATKGAGRSDRTRSWSLGRREFLAGAAALVAATTQAGRSGASQTPAKKYRAAVIGHTGRGLPESSWVAGRNKKEWIPVSSAGVGQPEPLDDRKLEGGNVLAVKDLLAAVEEDRQPQSSIYEARTATEMIVAVFESQRLGGPVTFPLANRQNPLALL